MVIRWLLRLAACLYPRSLRRDHGDELAALLTFHLTDIKRRRPFTWPVAFVCGALSDRRRSGPASVDRSIVIAREMRWGLRGLRARAWTAVLSMTLVASTAAATTLVFASADGILFGRVPFPEPERLVKVGGNLDGQTFDELRRQTDVFSNVGGSVQTGATFLETPSGLLEARTAGVTVGTFETLGIVPRWGRGFADSDLLQPGSAAVVLSAAFAARVFGEPARAVGQTLRASGEHLEVIGVMPSGFGYPSGVVALWRVVDPLRLPPMTRITSTARLAPGVWHTQAMSMLMPRFPSLVWKQNQTFMMVPETFGAVPESVRVLFAALLGAALCLLLAVCANLFNLDVTLELRRAQTLSVRRILGASKASLVTSAILERVVLAAGALLMAAPLTAFGATALRSLLPADSTTLALETVIGQTRSWLFLVIVTTLAWLPSTVTGILHASRASASTTMRTAGPVGGGRGWRRMRHGMMAAQAALAVALLIGGTVYVRAYVDRLAYTPPFDATVVAEIELKMPEHAFSRASAGALQQTVMTRLAAHHTVESVVPVFVGVPPQSGGVHSYIAGADDVAFDRHGPLVGVYFADPGVFATLGLPFVRGGTWDDTASPEQVVIGESLAARLWPDREPVGRRLEVGKVAKATVSGVIPDIKLRPLISPDGELEPRDAVFVPAGLYPSLLLIEQRGFIQGKVLVRLRDAAHLNQVMELARAVDPRALLVAEVLEDRYHRLHAQARMAASVMTTFAIMASVIAVAGMFGVMAFLVASRQREFGICLALGADQRTLQTQVLATALRLVTTGVVIGTATAGLGERAVRASLAGIPPTHWWTYGTIAGVAIGVTLLAAWGPARQVTRIDPSITLRTE